MFLLALFTAFLSLLSNQCQAADSSNAQSLSSTKLETLNEYPELALIVDDSDFGCAFVLGTYISQPGNSLLCTAYVLGQVSVYVEVAELYKFLNDDLMKVPTTLDIAEFVTRTMDLEKLNTEITGVGTLFGFSDLHNLIAKCAKSHLAVVSIDIAILKWVDRVAKLEKVKPHIFKSESPIVNEFTCQSLVSLMFYPGVHRYIEAELNGFIEALETLHLTQSTLYDCYAESVARLMLPLPEEGYSKQKLSKIITHSSLQKFAVENPNARFSDLLMFHQTDKQEALKEQSFNHDMKLLIAASTKNVLFDIDGQFLLTWHNYYNGSLSDGGKVAKANYSWKLLKISSEAKGNGSDVFVAARLPLSEEVLNLLWRYARGDALSVEDLRDIFYIQASYGILMFSAPQISAASH